MSSDKVIVLIGAIALWIAFVVCPSPAKPEPLREHAGNPPVTNIDIDITTIPKVTADLKWEPLAMYRMIQVTHSNGLRALYPIAYQGPVTDKDCGFKEGRNSYTFRTRAYEYNVSKTPDIVRDRQGNPIGTMGKTFKQCMDYDYVKLRCKKWK